MFSGLSDERGVSRIHLCWDRDDEPYEIEALLPIAEDMFTGTTVSFANTSNTYCIVLPQYVGGHCGEWGTGPHLQR